MIGMFAISEVLRFAVVRRQAGDGDRPAVRQRLRRHVGAAQEVPACSCCAARRSAPLVGALPGAGADIAAWMSYAHVEEVLEGAGEVRHRPRRRHRRIGRGQQLGARRRVDPGAGVRHPRRLDHRHRHRRALPEGHEPGADAVRRQPAEHLRGVHRLHPGAAADAAAGLDGDQGGQAHPAHPGARC